MPYNRPQPFSSQFIICSHPLLHCYITCAVEKVSLNKLKNIYSDADYVAEIDADLFLF
jgi:hypothetical protein